MDRRLTEKAETFWAMIELLKTIRPMIDAAAYEAVCAEFMRRLGK